MTNAVNPTENTSILAERVARPRPSMSELSLWNMVESLEILPIMRSKDFLQIQDDDQIEFRSGFGAAVERSGVPAERLSDAGFVNRYPRFRVRLDQNGRDAISGSSIYGGEGRLAENHDLCLNAEGQVLAQLFKISARDKPLGVLSPEMMERLTARAAELIARRDKEYAPKFLAEKAKAELAVAVSAAGSTLLGQFGLLRVEGNEIRLPEANLSHYPEIKKLITNAGGSYQTDKLGSFFTFPDGLDAADVLAGLSAGNKSNVKKETQFFATPLAVGTQAIGKFEGVEGRRVLEPEAGDGALADLAQKRGAEVTTIENWPVNIAALKSKGYAPLERDFLTVRPDELDPFDFVLMNPPFSNRQDIAHVSHALGFLKPEGELCAVMSPVFQTSAIKDAKKFKDLVETAGAVVEDVDAGAFKASGTSVRTVLLHVKMQPLLMALKERGETGEEYGLDLSQAWAKLASTAPRP